MLENKIKSIKTEALNSNNIKANQNTFVNTRKPKGVGTHLIVDIWGAQKLTDQKHIEQTIKKCVKESGATLLPYHTHKFDPNGGISGVAILAESHISIHTWPEIDYAAFDFFTCGLISPESALQILHESLKPKKLNFKNYSRGALE